MKSAIVFTGRLRQQLLLHCVLVQVCRGASVSLCKCVAVQVCRGANVSL